MTHDQIHFFLWITQLTESLMSPKPKKSNGIIKGRSESDRKDYGENENIEFVSEVEGRCPKCDKKLLNKRVKNYRKDYELAHIFPLKPTKEEVEILRDQPRLSIDPNDARNIIALCLACHNEIDNPRTIEGYMELYEMKSLIIRNANERESWFQHPLAEVVSNILRSLIVLDSDIGKLELEYNPHTVDEKTKPDIPSIKRKHIKLDVQLFYSYIKKEMANIEREEPGMSESISLQVKLYHNTLFMKNFSKSQIYDSMVQWIKYRSGVESIPACEAVTSFFVQNCEIFRAI